MGRMVNTFARLCLLALILSGCTAIPPSQPDVRAAVQSAQIPTATPATQDPGLTPSPAHPGSGLWVDASVPAAVAGAISAPGAAGAAEASATLAVPPEGAEPARELARISWVYALATPFPGRLEDATLAEVRQAWGAAQPGREIWLSAETLAVFGARWGAPAPGAVHVAPEEALLEQAWDAGAEWALVPFERLEPRWRVLRVDNRSPYDPDFRIDSYPLAVPIVLSGADTFKITLPPSNYIRGRLTVLSLSGVTALARRTAALMNAKGVLYPASQVGGWLRAADLTHISNEVSFNPDCPPEKAAVGEALFCSPPDYIRLLEAAGADVIELTGNHNFDRGQEAYEYSLELYRERGWPYYGGGENLAEASRPLIIEHNGNRLAFLGCNMSGPDVAWAGVDKPGAAPCDFEKMRAEVRSLREQGCLPIVTLQAFETEDYKPAPMQQPTEFVRLAEAGAVVVSGSQAHVPQGFQFAGDGLIHFGLGNLFFDQSDSTLTQRAFIDRQIFYQGRYQGVDLFTVRLEEYGKPVPMRPEERKAFLETIFDASGW